MIKKVIGYVVLAHIIVITYLMVDYGGEEELDSDVVEEVEESPLVPIGAANQADPAPALEQRKAADEATAFAGDGLVKLDSPSAVGNSDSSSNVLAQNVSFDFVEQLAAPQVSYMDELRTGIVYDFSKGKVLWERNSDEPVPIASMTKMMTSLLVIESVESDAGLTWQTPVKVTDAAYRMGGSQVWLDPRETFSLEALMISIFVQSANDSSYLVGEFLAGGDMSAFVARMNERAKALSMDNTHFINAHGLPDKGNENHASAKDLVRLGSALISHEKAREWASIQRYVFRDDPGKETVLTNHNRLIGKVSGVDGLKTGYTKAAGYCVTTTCLRGDRRIVFVVTGFKSSKHRDQCVHELVEWAYQTAL